MPMVRFRWIASTITGSTCRPSFFPIKKKLELYGVTSRIFGEKSLGFRDSREFIAGGNYYWFDSRNVRTNVQFMDLKRSPAGSVFGFYVGGRTGQTISVATSFYF